MFVAAAIPSEVKVFYCNISINISIVLAPEMQR
jgi:hypothetical protein